MEDEQKAISSIQEIKVINQKRERKQWNDVTGILENEGRLCLYITQLNKENITKMTICSSI